MVTSNTSSRQEENIGIKLKIFPNPTDDILIVEIFALSYGEIHLSIFNVFGETIYRDDFSSEKYSIDVSGFARGLYIVEIKDEKNIARRKFVKE